MKYRCVLADPPWPLKLAGQRKRPREGVKPSELPYKTMTIEDISKIDISNIVSDDCHLWLWTTNQNLEDGFHVMRAWGFKYLAPVHWIKPSGMGNWFIHRTQTILFGYRKKCIFPGGRYRPNILNTSDPLRHSEKPKQMYDLIESISPAPRLELFARLCRHGWDSWGDEVDSTLSITLDKIPDKPANRDTEPVDEA